MIQYARLLENMIFTKRTAGMMSNLPSLFQTITMFSFTYKY